MHIFIKFYKNNIFLLFQLINRELDISLGFHMCEMGTMQSLQHSLFYFKVPLLLVIKSSSHQYHDFEQLMLPFQRDMWLLLIAALFMAYVSLFWVYMIDVKTRIALLGYINNRYMYNSFMTLLGAPCSNLKSRKCGSRILILTALLGFMVIRTAYLGQLYYQLSNDIQKSPPKNIDEALKEGYKLHISKRLEVYLKHIPELETTISEFGRQDYTISWLKNSEEDKNMVVAPSSILKYFRYIDKSYFKLETIKNGLLTQNICMYFQPKSIIVNHFNKILEDFISFGFLQNWLSEFMDEREIVLDHSSVRPITLHQLSPIFRIWLYVNSWIFLIFLLEILSETYKPLKKVLTKLNEI